jgi:hypothetical protein
MTALVDARGTAREQNLVAAVPTEDAPTESQLLDVLYEVLAQGVPAKGRLTPEQVERFLHEHARSRKSVAEMLEFFEQHELPTEASAYGSDPELGELASGLHRERAPLSASFSLADELEGPERSANESGPMRKMDTPLAVEVEVDTRDATQRAVAPMIVSVPMQPSWVLPVACGVCVAFAAALLGTYRHAHDLNTQLNQARLQQRSTDVALSALEQRAETLRGALDQSETQRKALATRFDEFVFGEAQKRAAEEVALERLLGSRFQSLRDRALQQALVAPSP